MFSMFGESTFMHSPFICCHSEWDKEPGNTWKMIKSYFTTAVSVGKSQHYKVIMNTNWKIGFCLGWYSSSHCPYGVIILNHDMEHFVFRIDYKLNSWAELLKVTSWPKQKRWMPIHFFLCDKFVVKVILEKCSIHYMYYYQTNMIEISLIHVSDDFMLYYWLGLLAKKINNDENSEHDHKHDKEKFQIKVYMYMIRLALMILWNV